MMDKMKTLRRFLVFLLSIQISAGDEVKEECKPPCLYIANLTSILRVPLNKTTGTPLQKKPQIFLHTTGHIRSLEIDPVKQEIYWGDFKYHTINKSSIDGTKKHTLFQYAIGHPQGMAVDWSSDNIYWTDSLMDVIEVADTRGFNRKVLFDLSEEAEPRGIVAHPVEGFLFWTDWGKTPKIERSSLSGEGRMTIVSQSITWPNDLAIDYKKNRLYWVDAKLDALYSSTFNGSGQIMHHELTYNGGLPHPYSMAYSTESGFAYLSDWHTDSVYLARVFSNHNVSLILSNKDRKRNIGQIRLLTEFNRSASKPCEGHQCSHMCLKSGRNSSVCDCPTGMQLSNDKKTCASVPRDYEIYFADSYAKTVNHLIKFKGQPGFKVRPLSVPTNEMLESPLALDYDPEEKLIYWTDSKTGKTYRMQENGQKFEVLSNHKVGSYGLAVDKINKILYWFENRTSLVMSKLDGEHKKTLVKSLSLPRDIALYEEKGYIYFSDLQQGYIHRILGDGTKLLSLRSRYLISATGLAVDKVGNRVYWCDHKSYSIESVDLDFGNHRKLVQKTIFVNNRFWLTGNSFVVNPFSIAVLGEQVFWSDSSKGAIYSVDKHSGGNITYITGGLDHPRDIHVYRDYVKNETRRIFYVEYLNNKSNNRYATCSSKCPPKSVFNEILEPSKCPVGYKEANYGHSCSNCSDAFGGNFKCECKDWMTCAQRGYGNFYGCHPQKPFMIFKVRECVQVVKPGYCPFMSDDMCVKTDKRCEADEDCIEDEKCCKTSCSQVCRKTITKSDHPCTKNNGGCSHFCVRASTAYHCICPDGWYLDRDGKKCVQQKAPIITDVCMMPSDHGPCQPYVPINRWFYNHQSKQCEEFSYGGCGGNKNNYKTKEECQKGCGGVCPKFDGVVGPCVITNSSCTVDSDCSYGTLCCQKGCGKECVVSIHKSMSRCLLPKPTGRCKPNHVNQWYYDQKAKMCQSYASFGCHTTNENSFDTEIDCKASCDTSSCKLKPESGPCKAAMTRYYYDPSINKCTTFQYGGCNGNLNNFQTRAECENKCSMPVDLCDPNPCKNNGSCDNEGELPVCTCPNFFGGKHCEVNLEKGTVSTTFSVEGQMTQESFVKTTAAVMSKYCSQNGGCFQNIKARKRRFSVPYFDITEKDIRVFEFQQTGEKLRVDFAVMNPNSLTEQQSFMELGELQTIVKQYDQLSQNPNIRFEKFESTSSAVLGPGGKDRNRKATTKIVIGILVAFIVVCVLLAAVWFVKKRRFDKPTATSNDPGPVSFENQLYDDIHSRTKVELPIDNSNEEQSPRYAIPTPATGASTSLADYANVTSAAGHVLPEYEEPAAATDKKTVPSNWVQFQEDEENKEDFRKVPITNFVQPNTEYHDPYDIDAMLNEPPPDYTSRPGSFSSIRAALPRVEDSPLSPPASAATTPRSSEKPEGATKIDVLTIGTDTDC